MPACTAVIVTRSLERPCGSLTVASVGRLLERSTTRRIATQRPNAFRRCTQTTWPRYEIADVARVETVASRPILRTRPRPIRGATTTRTDGLELCVTSFACQTAT